MFRGVATVSLDSKSRLVVPARYRDALLVNGGGRVVITADPSQCLLLYPLPEWEPIEKKLNGLSDFNPRTRSLKQLLVGYAHDMDMDSAGRVLAVALDVQPREDWASFVRFGADGETIRLLPLERPAFECRGRPDPSTTTPRSVPATTAGS